MTTSSLSGKPDDYESRKSWTNKDWFTHVGAWENEHGQLCFGSTIAFSAMMQQFHRTHTQHIPEMVQALEAARTYVDRAYECAFPDEEQNASVLASIDAAIAKARGGK